MDIVVTGYAGLEGSIAIYRDALLGARVRARYPESFFRVFEAAKTEGCDTHDGEINADSKEAEMSQQQYANDRKESTAAFFCCTESDSAAAQLDSLYISYSLQGLAADGSDGGVLAALWKVLKANHKGGRYALRDIPLMQQTVEVCEMYALNPYRLYAPGCRVWLCTDTGALKTAAAAAAVPLSVIGFTSKGVAIKRTDTDADSSLRRPEGDELHKVLQQGENCRDVSLS